MRLQPPLDFPGRLLTALLLPLLVLLWVQRDAAQQRQDAQAYGLTEARMQVDDAARPPAALGDASPRRLPLRREAGERGAMWLSIALPPSREAQELVLSFSPSLGVFLDGEPLLQDSGPADRLVLGHRRLSLPISPSTQTRQLQLRLAAPGPSGASLDAPLFGPPAEVRRLDESRSRWQLLRTATLLGGLLVAVFLGLVARVRREEPLFLLGSLHVALLALLLSPYVLPEQPLPSPLWRLLLDAADLGAKLLLVAIAAHLAGRMTLQLRRLLALVALVGLPLDALAALQGWSWSQFGHPWAWWALGLRAALLLAAWAFALDALRRRSEAAAMGTALLVGLSALTWAWVSLGVLVLERPVIDSNVLAHAGWVGWVAWLLQRLFVDGASRERELREQMRYELAARTAALQQAYAAQAEAERRHAAAEQRRRLLQDLHDGLGARLLQLRLTAPQLSSAELADAVDACLLEMRLSIDTLSENEGELGVLLGGWRQRVEPLLQAAGVQMVWRVQHADALPCLQGAGGLELVRWLQEALSNLLRHAQARTLTVATEPDEGGITLWFVDDGRGLAPEAAEGQGRRNLRARAARLGAELVWHSPAPRRFVAEGVGTALALRLRE
jgi:signal transduction histidine kinase